MRYEEFIKNTVKDYISKGRVKEEDFPDMDIYMDQAETFMNKELSIYKKREKDKVITKTMIGNYVKHNMLPRPVNKRYSKDHLVLLTLIYYLKGTFQMEEIEKLIKPLIDNYNSEFDEKFDLSSLYTAIFRVQAEEQELLPENLSDTIDKIKHRLSEAALSEDDTMELFMLIVTLSMKADAQKFLAHKLMQEYILKPNKKK